MRKRSSIRALETSRKYEGVKGQKEAMKSTRKGGKGEEKFLNSSHKEISAGKRIGDAKGQSKKHDKEL